MSESKLEILNAYLEAQGWQRKPGKAIPYGEQIIISDGTYTSSLNYYPKRQSLVVGGSNSPLKDLLEYWVKSQSQNIFQLANNPYANSSFSSPSENSQTQHVSMLPDVHIGMDESGKGDWFGPLVIGAVYITKEIQHQLGGIGVKDSKLLKSQQIQKIAFDIKNILPPTHYKLLIINPRTYNQLYAKHKNINLLLADCYAQLAAEIQKMSGCSVFVCDQFSQDANRLKNAFAMQHISSPIQLHNAESMSIAVAAASILASEAFTESLHTLGIAAGFSSSLPKGSSQVPLLEKSATHILAQGGEAVLAQYAKVHFQPIQNLLKGGNIMSDFYEPKQKYVDLLKPYPPTIQLIRYHNNCWQFILVDGCIVEWADETASQLVNVKGNVNASSYRVLIEVADGKSLRTTPSYPTDKCLVWLRNRIHELVPSAIPEVKTALGIGWTYTEPLINSRFEFTDGTILTYYHNGKLQIQGTPSPTTRAVLDQLPDPFLSGVEALKNNLKQYFPDWQLGSGSKKGMGEAKSSKEEYIDGINWKPFWPTGYSMRKSASSPERNPCQQEFIHDWSVILSPEFEKKHMLAHAPTGLGKTVSSLVPALAWIAMAPDRRCLYYLVNRVNQHDNPIKELEQNLAELFQEKTGQPLRVVDLVGKKYLCHHYQSSSPQQSCKDARQNATFDLLPPGIVSWHIAKEHLGNRICSYHTLQGLMPKAHIVVCDYWWFFSHRAQQNISIKQIIGTSSHECILVVDEAHNLALRVQNELSVSATEAELESAVSNAPRNIQAKLRNILHLMRRIPTFSQDEIVQQLGGASFVQHLLDILIGDNIDDVSSSLLEKLLRLLLYPGNDVFINWQNNNVSRTLNARLLNSSVILQGGYKSVYASLSMSGTLAAPSDPTDELRYQISLFGLPQAKTLSKKYSSPFPARNARWIYCPDTQGTASRRGNYFDKYAEHIIKIGKKTPGVTAVFFSSYLFLEEVLKRVAEKLSDDCIFDERSLDIERQDNDKKDINFCKDEMQKILQKHDYAFLFAVYRGKIAEGANFDQNLIKTVICVSLPIEYNKEYHKRLKQLYKKIFESIAEENSDQLDEKAEEYAISRVSLSLVLQACGRGVRSEMDRCAFILLDERYGDKEYRWRRFFDPRPYNLSEPERIVESFHQDRKIEEDVRWDPALLNLQKEM